ncbi:MAG: hypothetical protein JWR39_514 [Devosia sp.]|jgi:hypothetical protein|nr:hypothetical protein [Devosia sp.]
MTHVLLTVLVQLSLGLALRRWLLGGLMMIAFYLGREITQAEYRWISAFGAGRRANMPWWGGLDPQAWNAKSVLDVLLPVLAVLAVYFTARILGPAGQPRSTEQR